MPFYLLSRRVREFPVCFQKKGGTNGWMDESVSMQNPVSLLLGRSLCFFSFFFAKVGIGIGIGKSERYSKKKGLIILFEEIIKNIPSRFFFLSFFFLFQRVC